MVQIFVYIKLLFKFVVQKKNKMKLEITQKGKMIDKSLPKVCTFTYAKKLQKQYENMGVHTVVLKDTRLRNSAIIDNYFINA